MSAATVTACRVACLALGAVALAAAASPCGAAGGPCTSVTAACCAGADASDGARGTASPFTLPLVAGDESPTLVLAQRVITRSWGLSSDSLYKVVRVPDWRSEGGAAVLSAAVPGSGELYVGERSGLFFLLAEAAGWTSHLLLRRQADDRRERAQSFAGDPGQSVSNWSFERWEQATQQDASELQQLYQADPSAFYRLIGDDPRYANGWVDDARSEFVKMQESADSRRRGSRMAAGLLWLNHVISAVDALRAARIHNLPLRRNLELQIRPSWHGGRPGIMAVVDRRF